MRRVCVGPRGRAVPGALCLSCARLREVHQHHRVVRPVRDEPRRSELHLRARGGDGCLISCPERVAVASASRGTAPLRAERCGLSAERCALRAAGCGLRCALCSALARRGRAAHRADGRCVGVLAVAGCGLHVFWLWAAGAAAGRGRAGARVGRGGRGRAGGEKECALRTEPMYCVKPCSMKRSLLLAMSQTRTVPSRAPETIFSPSPSSATTGARWPWRRGEGDSERV